VGLYSQVRALTRVATAQTEAGLVMIARHATAAQLDVIVGAYRGVLARALGGDERRYLRCDHDDDGWLLIRARLPAEEGALVLAAPEAGRDALRTGGAPGPGAARENDGEAGAGSGPAGGGGAPAEATHMGDGRGAEAAVAGAAGASAAGTLPSKRSKSGTAVARRRRGPERRGPRRRAAGALPRKQPISGTAGRATPSVMKVSWCPASGRPCRAPMRWC
jgi:hypothetical protein